jgi:proline racemase
MDEHAALGWSPPPAWRRITVIDSHTGGEPFRVVIHGLPDIPGNSVLERRRFAMEHLDHLRRALMWEPRGHADMYGGWVGPPVEPGSDLSVLFMHNEGFSTMCGHGIIALSKVLIDTGIVAVDTYPLRLRIDTPAGTVTSSSSIEEGRVVATTFRNVPSFAAGVDMSVVVEEWGVVDFDLAFGGAYYAVVEAAPLGLGLGDVTRLVSVGTAIKRQINRTVTIDHPGQSDLGFLYGVIFTGVATDPHSHSRNVCVFADGEVDRSPTGTGVSARLAILHARGEIDVDEEIVIESIVGSRFTGRVVEVLEGDPAMVVPEVGGSAHLVGRSELWIDPDDLLGEGFLIR